jgi:hypothetical protein
LIAVEGSRLCIESGIECMAEWSRDLQHLVKPLSSRLLVTGAPEGR